ncbi:FAD-binding domain-containing protein [Neolentinus lepideus HHB14362 ss-1]|uniref:FAD-binding domain-containing protein n=1 Tax=Neolentinus lepideus HHB14362 ss-1 TaxID=1314782 RepID=A0A165VXL7_9AGAM|nr:FAD-binding domain-containing protein [Neolentinus lepideus HHB14362 ss-1]
MARPLAIFAVGLLTGLYLPVLAATGTQAISATCSQIASSISSASNVYYPGSTNYQDDIEHFSSSSTQQATCSVEPGTAQDVATILTILGSTNTTFAVKGGGHTANPTFSSTTGVQIAMIRFNNITYNADASTVDVGTGLIWDDVYEALAPYGVNVVGGRVSGIGVAGFTLGGGYSFLTNQYGLTIDTVNGFELVTPTGAILDVTESSHPDLMYALKGGYNNFGIVTRITLQTYSQGQVWGGLITYPGSSIPNVSSAIGNFTANVNDPKAAILASYNSILDQVIGSLTIFYDGPSPPAGIFDEFLAISSLTQNISSRTFLDLFSVNPSNMTAGNRGVFNSLMVLDYTEDLCNAILNQTQYWGGQFISQAAVLVSYDIEPFLPTLFSHGSTATSAWPPSRAQPYLPMNIYYAWESSINDQVFYSAAQESVATIKAAAVQMGQHVEGAFVYGNYAISGTPIADIFGDGLPELEAIRANVDPQNVMALTGGWRIPW